MRTVGMAAWLQAVYQLERWQLSRYATAKGARKLLVARDRTVWRFAPAQ